MCLQVKLRDPHLSALEVRFSQRGAMQIYVYLYVYVYLYLTFQLRLAQITFQHCLLTVYSAVV